MLIPFVAVLTLGAWGWGWTMKRAWPALLPLVAPAFFLGWAVITQITENPDSCYEECNYHWLYFFALVTGIVGVILTVACAAGHAMRSDRERS